MFLNSLLRNQSKSKMYSTKIHMQGLKNILLPKNHSSYQRLIKKNQPMKKHLTFKNHLTIRSIQHIKNIHHTKNIQPIKNIQYFKKHSASENQSFSSYKY